MQVFVTGIYRSGKTSYAQRHARQEDVPLIHFDRQWDYKSSSGPQVKRFLSTLPDDCVVDAVPFGDDYDGFNEWRRTHETLLVVALCPFDEWFKRPLQKKKRRRHVEQQRYADYHLRTLPRLEGPHSFVVNGRSMLRQNALQMIGFEKILLRRIERGGEHYDSRYQDVPEVSFKGYTGSEASWRKVRRLASWPGKKVIDLGCFHGYHCFRAEELGADVIGLDRSKEALDTARAINFLRGGYVTFREWEAGAHVPATDIILCLNALHHFERPAKVLASLDAEQVILEADKKMRDMILSRFNGHVTVSASDRAGRSIFSCQGAKR